MTENTSHIAAPTAAVQAVPPSLGDDLLRGADAIAEFLFGDRTQRRKVYYLTGEAKCACRTSGSARSSARASRPWCAGSRTTRHGGQAPAMHDPDPSEEHDLDYDEIDELDEIGAGEQLVLIWCNTRADWEWHWAPFSELAAHCQP